MRIQFGKAIVFVAFSASVFAQEKEAERISNSLGVLEQEVRDKNISTAILDQAICIAIYPSVKKVAIGIGTSYGRGVMVCRKNEEKSGAWVAPVMFALDQGSVGLQLGSTATDFVLVVLKKDVAEKALNGKAKLGSDAAVAAGPVGSQANAYNPEADVLTWTRTKGVFAGVSLSGASVQADEGANKAIYGKEMSPTQILQTAPIVPAAQGLVSFLNQTSPGRPRG